MFVHNTFLLWNTPLYQIIGHKTEKWSFDHFAPTPYEKLLPRIATGNIILWCFDSIELMGQWADHFYFKILKSLCQSFTTQFKIPTKIIVTSNWTSKINRPVIIFSWSCFPKLAALSYKNSSMLVAYLVYIFILMYQGWKKDILWQNMSVITLIVVHPSSSVELKILFIASYLTMTLAFYFNLF